MKRSKLYGQTGGLNLAWEKIIAFLNEKLEKSEMQSVNEDLKDILQAAKQIGMVLFEEQLIVKHKCHLKKRQLDKKQGGRKNLVIIFYPNEEFLGTWSLKTSIF